MVGGRRIDEIREEPGRALHRAMLEYLANTLPPHQDAVKRQIFTKILQEQKNNPIAIKQLSRNDYSHLEDALTLPFALNRDNPERATSKCLTLLQLWFEHVTDPALVIFLVTHKKNPQTPSTFQLACHKGPIVFFAFLDLLTKLKNEKKLTVAILVDALQGRDQMGKNIFHTAADSGNIELVEKLVQFTKSLMPNENGDDLIAVLLEIRSNYGFIPRFHRFDNTHPVNALLLKLNPEAQKRLKEDEDAAKQREEDLQRFRNLNKRELELAKRENDLIARERKLARHERFLESELAESNTKYDNLVEDYQSFITTRHQYESTLLKKIDYLESYIDDLTRKNTELKHDVQNLDNSVANRVNDLRSKNLQINQLLDELDSYQREVRERDLRDQEYYQQHRFYQPDPRDQAPLHPPRSSGSLGGRAEKPGVRRQPLSGEIQDRRPSPPPQRLFW